VDKALVEIWDAFTSATFLLADKQVISIDEAGSLDDETYHRLREIDNRLRLSFERKPEESDTGKDAVSILILKTLVNCCPKCKGVGSIGYYDDENQYKWRSCPNCEEARSYLNDPTYQVRG
jgi:hypothetical protein